VVPTITLSPAILPSDVTSVAYNQSITASGGIGATLLKVSNTQSPIAGLTISGNGTGAVSIKGTPTAAGVETFYVTATDTQGDTTGPVPYSITVNPPLMALSYFDSAVYKFDPASGALLQTLVAPYSQSTLNGAAGMAVGPDGNLYFSSQLNNSIVEYNLSTNTLSTFIPSAVLQPIASSNGDSQFAPAGLTFGPDDNLYVRLNADQSASSGGAVIRFNIGASAGQLIYNGTSNTVATGLVQPTEMTFGVGANRTALYVSNHPVDLGARA
jgi:hypothetical protein